MLAKALFCLAAAAHFAELKPKGKYFLIETQDNVEGVDFQGGGGGGVDMSNTEEDSQKPMMTKEGKTKYNVN